MATPEEEDRLRRLLGLLEAPLSTTPESETLFPVIPAPTPPVSRAPVSQMQRIAPSLSNDQFLKATGITTVSTTTPLSNEDFLKAAGITPTAPITPARGDTRTTTYKPEELTKAATEKIAAEKTAFGMADVEGQKAAQEQVQNILTQDYTTGGTPIDYTIDLAPYTPRTRYEKVLEAATPSSLVAQSREQAKQIEEGGGSFFSAFRPQVVSPNWKVQQGQYEQNVKDTIDSLKNLSNLTEEQKAAQVGAIKENWKDTPSLVALVDSIAAGSTSGEDLSAILSEIETQAKELAPEKSWFLVEDAGGRLVEGNTSWALRLLNSPVALLAGAIEGAYTSAADQFAKGDPNVGQTATDMVNAMSRYVREGRSFTDLVSQATGYIGRVADEQLFGGREAGKAEEALTFVGGAGGLVADFFTGPDDIVRLPIQAASKTGQTATKAAIATAKAVAPGAVENLTVRAPEIAQKLQSAVGQAKVAAQAIPGVSQIAKSIVTRAQNLSTTPQEALVRAASNDLIKTPSALPPRLNQAGEALELGQDTLTRLENLSLDLQDSLQEVVNSATTRQLLAASDGPQMYKVIKRFQEQRTAQVAAAQKDLMDAGILSNIPVSLLEQERKVLGLTKTFDALDNADQMIVRTSLLNKAVGSLDPKVAFPQIIREALRQNLIKKMSQTSFNESNKIAKSIVRITPGRFVAIDAVEPVLKQAAKELEGWRIVGNEAERVGDNVIIAGVPYAPGSKVDLPTYNNIIRQTTEKVIDSSGVFWLPASRVENVVNDIKRGIELKPQQVIQEGNRAQRLSEKVSRIKSEIASEINITPIRNLFVPKEIQPSVVSAVTDAVGRFALNSFGEGKRVGPISDFVKDVTNAWGSIFDIFKLEVKKAQKGIDVPGGVALSPSAAYGKVIFEDPEVYFKDYLNLIYGANDDFAEVYRGITTSSGMIGDKRKLVSVISNMADTHLGTAKQNFVDAYKAGDYNEAFNTLLKVHTYLSGRTLGDIVDISNIPDLNDKIRMIAPQISPDQFMKATSIAWTRKKQLDLLRDRMFKMLDETPEAFGVVGPDLRKVYFDDYANSIISELSKTSFVRNTLDKYMYLKRFGVNEAELATLRERTRQEIFDAKYLILPMINALKNQPEIVDALVKAEMNYKIQSRLAELQNLPQPPRPTGIYALLKRKSELFVPEVLERGRTEKNFEQAYQEFRTQTIEQFKPIIENARNEYMTLRDELFPEDPILIQKLTEYESSLQLLTTTLEQGKIRIQQRYAPKVKTPSREVTWDEILTAKKNAIIRDIKAPIGKDELRKIKDENPYFDYMANRSNNPDEFASVMDPSLDEAFMNALKGNSLFRTSRDLEALGKVIRGSFVRNALTDTRSVIDALNSIVDLEKTGVGKKLVQASDVKQLGSTLRDIILPMERRAVAKEQLISLDQAMAMSLEELKKAPRPIREAAIKPLSAAAEFFSRANNFAKTGVLSGVIVPNFGYIMDNLLTLPLITINTLGSKLAGQALVSSVAGLPGLAIKNFATDGSKVFKGLIGDLPAEQTIKLGDKVYTLGQLSDIIAEGSVLRSQAGSELSRRLVDDMLAYSGRTEDLALAGNLNRLFEQSLGGAGKRGNFLSDISDAVDKYWRVNVFTNALKEGRSEAEAIKLARESLFDYGSLTEVERKYIARAIWFYTFWSRNLLQTFNTLLTRPQDLAKIYQIQQATRPSEPSFEGDYTKSKLFKVLLDSAANERYALVGSSVPAIDALDELLSYGGGFIHLAGALTGQDKATIGSAFEQVFKNAASIPLERMRPEARIPLTYAFGAEIRDGEVKQLSDYIDPRFAWYLQQKPGAWETFNSIIPVDIQDKLKPGASYFGYQYKVRPGYEKRWYLLQQALMYAGVNRSLRDYAEVLQPLVGTGGLPSDKPAYQVTPQDTAEWIGRASGVLSPVSSPSESQRRALIEQERLRQLRGE